MAEDAGRKDGLGDELPSSADLIRQARQDAEADRLSDAEPRDFTESEIRRELGEILGRISALPSDAIEERVALAARQAELRAALAKVPIPGSDQIKERWSDQSGRKLSEDESHPIISRGATGGGGAGG